MADESRPSLIVQEAEGVTVVRLPPMDVFDEATVRDLARQLEALVSSAAPSPRFVVDLAALEMATSRVLGTLLALKSRLEARGGRLRLIGCSTGRVADAFRVTHLDRIFAIDPDEPTALASV
jgi:anti-sigma B factor antagonist